MLAVPVLHHSCHAWCALLALPLHRPPAKNVHREHARGPGSSHLASGAQTREQRGVARLQQSFPVGQLHGLRIGGLPKPRLAQPCSTAIAFAQDPIAAGLASALLQLPSCLCRPAVCDAAPGQGAWQSSDRGQLVPSRPVAAARPSCTC